MKRVELKFARRKDVNDLCEVERKAWALPGEIIIAEPRKIKRRVETKQVVTIARVDGEPAGSQFAFQFDWNGNVDTLTTWDKMTHEGWTDKAHNSDGSTGFLVGVGVISKFRQDVFANNLVDSSQRISQLLLINTFRELYQRGVRKVVGCARIPFYHQKPGLAVERFCQLKRSDGLLFDPVLRFHKRLGADIIKPIVYAMDDNQSLNGGCWVRYDLDYVFSMTPWNTVYIK